MANSDGGGQVPRGGQRPEYQEVAKAIRFFFRNRAKEVRVFTETLIEQYGESKVVMGDLLDGFDGFSEELNNIVGPVDYLAGDEPLGEESEDES